MPSYLILGNYTEEGIKNMKGLRGRVDEVKQLFQQHGARQIFWYLTFGPYDFAALVEVPDTDTMARLALILGEQGRTRTATLQALTEEEAYLIAESLP